MTRSIRSLALPTLLAVILVLAQRAHASSDPLGSGTVKLTVDPGFTRLLKSHGASLTAAAPARRAGGALVLPVAGGALDPIAMSGEVDTDGRLVFARGARNLPLRDVVIRSAHAPLLAKVGGGQLKVATAARIGLARAGFGSRLSAQPLRLTAKLATRLAKKLHLHRVFAAGQIIGTLRADAEPLSVAVLPLGRATLTPDPAFAKKLDGLFVSVNPIAPAERAAGPLFTLPIIGGGALSPDGATGELRSGGSLEFLQLGAGQIFWHELWFQPGFGQVLAEADLEPAPTFAGKLGQVPILTLGPGTLASDPGARTITTSGAPLALSATTAGYFNQAFAAGKSVFAAGELLGTLSFVAQSQ